MSAKPELVPKLDKYELLEDIGHGGMATVYRARDRRLGREVAVKIIHRHLRENREVATRFESEARAVAKLRHPNIVEVYDVSDADEEERYLVVELVRGTTLRKLLSDQGHLPPEVAAAIGAELCAALQHAHDFGVVHRDIKPENVLIVSPDLVREADGARDPVDVKLTDFGIAKLLDAQGVTSTGQVLGSPAHMAPEQIEGGEVGARSDVFGLGVLLYECMVGRLPFDGRNPAQVLRRVLEGVFTPADRAQPSVGGGYAAILGKALAHEPAQRYASVGELRSALEQELTDLGVESPRRELHAFLANPAAYREAHESRTVEALVGKAKRAREQGDVTTVSACYNRALAYRPHDQELLASVSNLVRRERLRRFARRGLAGLAGATVVAAGVVAIARLSERYGIVAPPAPPSASVVAPAPKPKITAERPPARPAASVVRERPTRPERSINNNNNNRPAPEPKERPKGDAFVKILIDGPASAIVRVDGAVTPWFGKILRLPAGKHSFAFEPPDEICCEHGQRLDIEVPPSAGPTDVFTVKGRIEFRPATLSLQGPPGSRVSCGPLGQFSVPSEQRIAMTGAIRKVECTFFPPEGSAEVPKPFDLTLRAGGVFTNLGQ